MSTKDKGGSKDNENKRSEQERQETDLDKQAAQAILKGLCNSGFCIGWKLVVAGFEQDIWRQNYPYDGFQCGMLAGMQ